MITKFGGRSLQWTILLAAALVAAHADAVDTIPILSGSDLTGTTQWNSRTGANVLVDPYPEPIWKAPTLGGQWISFAPTGQSQVSVPDDGLGSPTAIFYSRFTLPAAAISGDLWIFADDTAQVWLDDALLIPLAPPTRGYWCAASAISCTPAGGGHVSLAGLDAGPHTLEVRAYQLWGDTFGVLYEGNVAVAAVPEPSTFLLMATGICLAWIAMKSCHRVRARISASAQAGRDSRPPERTIR